VSRDVFRRYPALAYLVGAGVLAVLLPSALIVPNSGPPTLAEYAPVTGDGDGTGDLSHLGQAGSGGLGSGRGSDRPGASRPDTDDPLRPVTRKAGTKRCVGTPPRQTEDLLSPPCIAFFDGDNGGATAKGVTKDEVRLVLILDSAESSGLRGKWFDCALGPSPDDPPEVHGCKAFANYFGERYQTYNRRPRVWAYFHRTKQYGTELQEVVEKVDPFGIVAMGEQGNGSPITSSAANRQIMGAAYEPSSRDNYLRRAPYMVSFRQDTTEQRTLAASFVCLKLKNGGVRFTDNPIDRGKRRVFGAVGYQINSGTGTEFKRIVRDMCDIELAAMEEATDPNTPSKMKAANVTTAVLFPNTSGVNILATNNAAKDGWFPEWVVPGDWVTRGVDTNESARMLNSSQWRNAVGITFDYRRDHLTDQAWYRAYREGCPTCPEPADPDAPWTYDSFTMMFYGIQAAGPRLTPQNFDKGMHAIPPDRSSSPYKPAAYFAPDNYTFIKDAAVIWWDPAGRAPGDPNPGCYRMSGAGTRFRVGEYTAGDQDIRGDGDPCQGSATSVR